MQRILNISIALVLLPSLIFWLNCAGDNPAAVDLNPGTYVLASLTDKPGDFGVPGAYILSG